MKNRKMSYTKIGVLAAIIFLIIIVLFEFLFALSSKNSLKEITSSMLTVKYIATKGLFAILYGIFMVFLFKRKEKKIARK